MNTTNSSTFHTAVSMPWIHGLTSVAILAVILNITQIFLIIRKHTGREWKHSPVFFILSLSVADLLTAIFVLVNNSVYVIMSCHVTWNVLWGQVVCYGILNSFFHIIALTADRLHAVHDPLHHMQIMTRSRTIKILFLVWILSSLFAFNLLNAHIFMLVKAILILATGVFLGCVYTLIFKKVHRIIQYQHLSVGISAAEGLGASVDDLHLKIRKREIHSAVYCACVVLAFVACSYPMAINNLVNIGSTESDNGLRTFIVYGLMVVNSVCNPVLYIIKHTCMD